MEQQKFLGFMERWPAARANADEAIALLAEWNADEPMTALQFMIRLGPFWNAEEKKPASNSALRRWLTDGAILFNDERVKFDELIDFPVSSLVMFPKSEKRRCTLA